MASFQRDPETGFYGFIPAVGTVLPSRNGRIRSEFFPGEPNFEGYSRNQANLGWAFGVSNSSQTYILKQGNTFWESRLSYYHSLAALDITFGHNAAAPATIAQALGNPVEDETIRRCFACHSTASTVAGKFDPEHAILGVTCEACHGPSGKADNSVTNLYWGSPARNQEDRIRDRTSNQGERQWRSKLVAAQVQEIRRLYSAGGTTQRQLAAKFNVRQGTIKDIVRRITWKHLPAGADE